LRELAETYNSGVAEYQKINLTRVKTKLEFILSLWEHQIKIPESITFGEPYDSCFSKYCSATLTYKYLNGRLISSPIDDNFIYFLLTKPEFIRGVLFGCLNMSRDRCNEAREFGFINDTLKNLKINRSENFDEIILGVYNMNYLEVAYLVIIFSNDRFFGSQIFGIFGIINMMFRTLSRM
jgi:hypothetical protein